MHRYGVSLSGLPAAGASCRGAAIENVRDQEAALKPGERGWGNAAGQARAWAQVPPSRTEKTFHPASLPPSRQICKYAGRRKGALTLLSEGLSLARTCGSLGARQHELGKGL